MKVLFLSLTILSFLGPCLSNAWSWERKRPMRQYDYRPEQIDQFRNRQQYLKQTNSSSRSSHEIAKSDVGLQRPVESKKKGFGYQFGFSSKIYHTNNPLSSESGPQKVSAGIWENSISNNFLLGAYDLRGATFSPVIGLSYTNFNHFGHDVVKEMDFGSISLNFAGIFTFGKGWSLRPSLGYTADLSLEDSMSRQYSQVSPGIALGKSFSIGKAQSFLEWSMNYTFTNTPDQMSKDLMDRFESGLTWGIDIPFGDFEFSPFINLALIDYSNQPQSRTDFRGTLGLNLTYSITDWMALRIYSTLSSRNSSEEVFEFTRLDTGAGATLNARF
jgi:hypothetical protein